MRHLKIIFVVVFSVIFSDAVSQFDKKVTFNTYAGTLFPLGSKVNGDSVPNVFPNFHSAVQMGIGLQYNLNSNLALGANVGYFYAFDWKDVVNTSSVDQYKDPNFKSYFSNLSVGAEVRYKFFSNKRFIPYILGGANLNFFSCQIAPRLGYYKSSTLLANDTTVIKDQYTVLRYNAKQISTTIAGGVTVGAGMDCKLSESFIIFIQGGYGIIFTKYNKDLYQNTAYFNTQLGIRFSLFKSKSIL